MAEVSKLEMYSLSEYQKSLYHDIDNKNNEVTNTPFYAQYQRSFFNVQTRVKMSSVDEGSSVVYTLPHEHHYLMYTYMVTKFPSIRVKPEYQKRVQICWPHNLGTSHVLSASFRHDTLDIQSFDNLWYDINSQYLIKPTIRDLYDIGMGNIKAIEGWSSHLPAYPCVVPQPFYYSKLLNLAFPVGLCDPKSKITHRFNFRLKIGDLLRMRCRKDETLPWTEVDKVNFEYLEGASDKSVLSTPELWARCASVTKEELSWNRSREVIMHYIENVVSVNSPNPAKTGATIDLPIVSTNACQAFFWVAENVSASKLHNYSNYTTNHSNAYHGYDPIESWSLKYGTQSRIDSLESYHNSIIEPMFHARSTPNISGYHMACMGSNLNGLEIDSTLALGKLNAVISVKIGSPDPFAIVDGKGSDDIDYLKRDNKTSEKSSSLIHNEAQNNEYLPKVRLLIMRRLTFTLKDGNKNGYYELQLE